MTEQHEQNDQSPGQSPGGQADPPRPEDISAEAERIVTEGENVRDEARRAVVDAVQNRRLGLEGLTNVSEQFMNGVLSGMRKGTPKDKQSVLRDVIDGLSDGFSSTATATRYALEEARGRGETFAREDVDRAVEHLRDLERAFVDTVTHVTSRAGDEISGQLHDLNDHIRRAASSMRPPIEDAIQAAIKHPVSLAGETARAGAKAVPHAAGMLLQTMSGILQGAGDALTGDGKKRDRESP